MNLKPSPTLAIAQAVEKRRALGKKAWSLSTPSFPEPDMLPDISSKWLKLSEPAGIPELRRKAQNIFFQKTVLILPLPESLQHRRHQLKQSWRLLQP